MGRYKIKYPCGLEIEEEGWYVGNEEEFNFLFQKGCPLHGKKCKW